MATEVLQRSFAGLCRSSKNLEDTQRFFEVFHQGFVETLVQEHGLNPGVTYINERIVWVKGTLRRTLGSD